jgi:membrane-bound ClpP family serine protease
VERFSARPLVFLHQMPRWALLLVVLGLLVSGFAVPGLIGAVLLLLVAILLGWLAYLSWPSINASGRVLRVLALACMVAIVVWQTRR